MFTSTMVQNNIVTVELKDRSNISVSSLSYCLIVLNYSAQYGYDGRSPWKLEGDDGKHGPRQFR